MLSLEIKWSKVHAVETRVDHGIPSGVEASHREIPGHRVKMVTRHKSLTI
jgi:hypothetical protein